MPSTLSVIIDPADTLQPHKDSSLAFIRYVLSQPDWQVNLIYPNDIWIDHGKLWAYTRCIEDIQPKALPQLGSPKAQRLASMDAIWIRLDPPFDQKYLYLTYLMSHALRENILVLNHPDAIRSANEKLCALWFPDFCPPHIITQSPDTIKNFVEKNGKSVLKPLDQMGGRGIFILEAEDPNFHSIIETSTLFGKQLVMVQSYLEAIKDGDCRILLIDGEPIPYTLVRKPSDTDFRGNMAAGGTTSVRKLSGQEIALCKAIGPTLAKKGLWFVGIDVIGGQLTEINVTSPTGIEQIEASSDAQICALLFKSLQSNLQSKQFFANETPATKD